MKRPRQEIGCLYDDCRTHRVLEKPIYIYIYIYILIMLSCTLSLSTAMSRMFWQENNEIVSTNLRMEILMIAFSNYHSRLSLRFNSILDINLCYSVPIKH